MYQVGRLAGWQLDMYMFIYITPVYTMFTAATFKATVDETG